MKETIIKAEGVRFSVVRDSRVVGRAYLYLLRNDLHSRPFGLLEDVHVDEGFRGTGIAGELLVAVLKKADSYDCYKIIATSRDDGTREAVHAWYVRLGFTKYGKEFRFNL